jgi:hypothetical protein
MKFLKYLMATGLSAVCAVTFVSRAQPSLSDKFLIRVEVDFDGRTPGAISPASLEKWSEKRKLTKAFEDTFSASLEEIVAKNITKTNPNARARTIELNSPTYYFGPEATFDPKKPPLWVAPFGTAKILPPKQSKLAAVRMATYRPADDEEISRLFSRTAVDDNYQIFVPDIAESRDGVRRQRSIQIELTRAQLDQFKIDNPKAKYKTINGAFPVVFGAEGKTSPRPLEENLKKTLLEAFSNSKIKEKKPLLIILDDSWPDNDSFLTTKNTIGKFYPLLWARNSDLSSLAQAPELPDEIKKLESPGIPSGLKCANLSTCESHSRGVLNAIAPLRELAKSKLQDEPVDIIFIPLGATQKGSSEILGMLWNLAYAAGTNIASNSPAYFPEEKKTQARQEKEFLGTLQTEIKGGEFLSNWGIVESVVHFAHKYAAFQEVPVYINVSWTTEDVSYNPPPMNMWNILLVAAAGNHCKDNKCIGFADQISPSRLFVTRSESPLDVLLVTNMDSNGKLTCNSSRIQNYYSVVGYDGALEGDCGTSYAAPRVAWLLAARAALSATPTWPKEQTERLKWLMQRPSRRICSGDDDSRCTHLDVTDLMGTLLKSNRPTIGRKEYIQ